MSEHDDQEQSFTEERLIEAVENQLEAGEPAAAKATLNKLTLVGYERDDILQLMAQVLAFEVNAMLENDQPFNLERYEVGLRALPELPQE